MTQKTVRYTFTSDQVKTLIQDELGDTGISVPEQARLVVGFRVNDAGNPEWDGTVAIVFDEKMGEEGNGQAHG